MRITIHQPSYWPWLGLLDKIAKAEKYIVLDDVAANKASFQYRNQFLCNGEIKLITLPVDYRLGKSINLLKFTNNSWREEHLNKIRNYYLKTPYFENIFPEIVKLYHSYNNDLAFPFILKTMLFAFEYLNINVDVVTSSQYSSNLSKGELVFDLCHKAKATCYVSGKGAEQYMDEATYRLFENNNIQFEWHHFTHPIYQQHPKFKFVQGLSCLDMFFWLGKENSRKVFWNNI